MIEPTVRYQSPDEDSGRWAGFPFWDGDIVISTRSKSGTTWLQMICELMVFQSPELPAPLSELSLWIDWLVYPREEVFERLAAQEHRRVIKTHTPLDGIPIDHRAFYVVAGRHPLDVAVSLYHQGNNINRAKWRELTGQPEPDEPPQPRPALREWLLEWIEEEVDPVDDLDSLPGIFHHLSDAWRRRREGNIVLVHYADLSEDLAGQMRDLAAKLGFSVPDAAWPALVEAASFRQMRARGEYVLPSPPGVLKDADAFFRSGKSGSGRALLSDDELQRYERRAATLADEDLLEWLHR